MANRLGMETEVAGNYPLKHNARERKLAETIREDKNLTDTFDQALIVSNMDNTDGTAYTGATGEVVAIHSGKAAYEVYQAAVASAAVVTPRQSADGLELKPVAAGDALELSMGTSSRGRGAMTVGTSEPFFIEATIKIDDISAVTEMFLGWRKAEAYQADPDSYDEMAAFNIGKDADGQIEIHTILNNAATAETDTTEDDWVDGGEHTLRIEVDAAGRCKFLLDGEEPAVTASFTFDDGEVVVPFLHLNSETGDPGVSISSWRVGKL